MKIHLVGGFLGSGKTTAIISAAKVLINQGLTVGVITNDQGKYLVDTNFIRLEDIPAVEVNGGCFCCNYTDFDQSLDQLINQIDPDVIFAESVGSCADVVATVLQPLLQFKDNSADDVSLSVFTDARLLRAFLAGADLPFQDGVIYLFKKQIEEANILVINKIDLLDKEQEIKLLQQTRTRYPDKIIISQSSLTLDGVKPWLSLLSDYTYPQKVEPLLINYQVYGAGEQVLAWYDGVFKLEAESDRLIAWINHFIHTVNQQIIQHDIAIGHLKFLVSDINRHQKISITSVTESEKIQFLKDDGWVSPITMIVNARVECAQQEIIEIINWVIQRLQKQAPIEIKIINEEAFHPGFPVPTHRLI